MKEQTLSILPAKNEAGTGPLKKEKIRVCAYCRVSTGQAEQLSSFEAQKNYYTAYIRQNPAWTFAGVFADEGVSGTSIVKRTAFHEMLRHCEAGEIDFIITKSISRFARNTVDCLAYIRQLKALNIPVYFEKENVNTMSSSGEFIITLLGSLAQEESRNISANIKWAIEKQFQSGRLWVPRLYGYRKDAGGNLIIHEDTAVVVTEIFQLYLEGYSLQKICAHLKDKEIQSPTGKANWSPATLLNMLQNEKYTGDAILQKYYSPDFLTRAPRRNWGGVPQYYVEHSHPAIISKEMFLKTQEEALRRKTLPKTSDRANKLPSGKYNTKHGLSNLIFCGCCQKPYRRVVWHAYTPPKAVWRCLNRLEHGKKICPAAPALDEKKLYKTLLAAVGLQENSEEAFSLNDGMVKQYIDKVTVVSKDKLSILFKSGNSAEAHIDRT